MRREISITILLTFLLAVLLLSITSCGPTITSSKSLPKSLGPIVVIPSRPPAGMSRERAAYITKSFQSELLARGYEVLSDSYVRAECGEVSPNAPVQCSAREVFFTKYGVAGTLTLSLSSLTSTNIIAAYYNSISGDLTLQGASGEQLLSVGYTERERGGLLLSGGQVLQGIRASVNNIRDDEDHFKILADKFATLLASKLPPPASTTATTPGIADTLARSAAPPKVQSVTLAERKGGNYLLCAVGPPALAAALVYSGGRTTLRETAPGTYCIVAPLIALSKTGQLEVEIRSPFYGAASKEISLASQRCDLKKFVKLRHETGARVVAINCTSSASSSEVNCNEVQRSCTGGIATIYTAPSLEGPFTGQGEIALDKIPAKKVTLRKGAPSTQIVAVVQRNKNTLPSEPIILKDSSLEQEK